MRSLGYGELIRGNRNFRNLLAGQFISELGNWFNFIAGLGLVRVVSEASPIAAGLFFLARLLPFALMSPIAGTFVDRFSRRQVMIVTDVLRFAVALSFLLVDDVSDLWIAYLATVVLHTAGAFFDGAKNAAAPNLTGKEGLLAGTALLFSTRFLLMAVGSALGGWASAIFGYQVAFIINAVSFLASAWTVWLIPEEATRDDETAERMRDRRAGPSFITELREGLKYSVTNHFALTILIMNMIWATGGGAINIIFERSGGVFFNRYSGTTRNMIVRIEPNGAVDTSFDPGTGANNPILNAALQPDGRVLVVGSFSTFNGTPKKGMARLNADGSLDPTFDVGSGISTSGVVSSIVVQPSGKIVLGGFFSSFNGHPTNNLVRLNPNGSVDTSIISGLESADFIRSMISDDDGGIVIAGRFSSYGGIPRNNIAKLRTDDPDGTMFDYDGDGRTDFSVFRPSSGAWYLQRTTAGFQGLQFGASGDKLTPADYDGDGKTDISIYRPSTGIWYRFLSATNTVDYPVFGVAEDLPAPGDYDGDGKADLTVFRPSQGTWYRQNSSNGTFFGFQFGANGDVPTVGDFDGDGKNDLGIFRPSVGDWYNIRSSDGSVFGERFGQTGDKIAPADYDGDGKTDIAIYRPSTGLWVVRNSATATYDYAVFGAPTDIPISGDYEGDGKADIGVWRPSDGTWYIKRSDNGQFIVFPWGQNGDVPTPSAYGN